MEKKQTKGNQRKNNGQFTKGNTEGNRFTKTNQPANAGRKGKSTTEYLKELGTSSEIEFEIKIHGQGRGRPKVKKGKVTTQGTMNELLATLLWADALQGNDKARKEILDRVEGKSKQTVDLNAKVDHIGMMPSEDRKKRIETLMNKYQQSNDRD